MGHGHGGREHRDGGPSISISFGTAAVAGSVVIGEGRPRGSVIIGERERDRPLPIPGYPQYPGPRPVFNGAADNRNFGPIMTQNGIDAAVANGPSLVLPNVHRGLSETSLNDGERIGVIFNFLPNGDCVYGKAFDLNNPAQAQDYNQFKRSFINLESKSSENYAPQYPRR